MAWREISLGPWTLGQAASRAKREVEGRRWMIDQARRDPRAVELRQRVERLRMQARVRRAGSADAVLDTIVAEAIAAEAVVASQEPS